MKNSKITLIEGKPNAGKSKWIKTKYEELKESQDFEFICDNGKGYHEVIYVFKNKSTGKLTVLNSGSDAKRIILDFRKFISKLSDIEEIYTAIRPKDLNPRLHKWMKDVLSIDKTTVSQNVITIKI